MKKLKERVLEDSYPVYYGHVYLVDGKPTYSIVHGTVLDLKKRFQAKEIKNCDLVGRALMK